MAEERQKMTRAEAVRSACALAFALLKGASVDAERFARELRTPSLAPTEPLGEADVTAFTRACAQLEGVGLKIRRGRWRRSAVRLDPSCVAEIDELRGREDVLENLAQILLAHAGASRHEAAREAHLAAAKLTRDFVLSGEPRGLPPTDTRTERALRDAMTLRQQVKVIYRREDGVRVERVLEPLRHVLFQGDDFLVATEAEGDGRLKTYHYSAFESAELTGVGFTPSPAPADTLFSPPFAYEIGRELPLTRVRFRVGGERLDDAHAALERLLCGGYFTRTPEPDGGELWEAAAASPEKAATFALRLGIEVLGPEPYRAAYLATIERTRKAFA